MNRLTPKEISDFFDACETGCVAAIESALAQDATLIDLQTPEGWSPLSLAVQWAQEETVALLLSRGANMELRDNAGCTARELADRLNFESIGNQFRQAAQLREGREQEQRVARSIEQYHSGLETSVTLPRQQLRLKAL